ncbi:MAG: O-antigen ligase family protein, partial [Terracidiphilus sp.]
MLTKSRTSLVCGVLTLAFYWAERLSRKYILTLLPTATILASVLIGAYLLDSEAAKQLNQTLLAGRDADTYENFSGRVPLWRLCMQYVAVRPVAGYGFYGFWTPERIRTVSASEGWAVPESHNGFIELMLGLGVMGLFLYLYHLTSTWRLLWKSYNSSQGP